MTIHAAGRPWMIYLAMGASMTSGVGCMLDEVSLGHALDGGVGGRSFGGTGGAVVSGNTGGSGAGSGTGGGSTGSGGAVAGTGGRSNTGGSMGLGTGGVVGSGGTTGAGSGGAAGAASGGISGSTGTGGGGRGGSVGSGGGGGGGVGTGGSVATGGRMGGNGGGGQSGSGGVGGSASSCPASPPPLGGSCMMGLTCVYENCATTMGRTSAECANGMWTLEIKPCSTFSCSTGAPCQAGQVCLVTNTVPVTRQCVANNCGAGPIACGCLSSCAGSCTLASFPDHVTVTCTN